MKENKKNNAISLSLAKRLKDAGYPQNTTYWNWGVVTGEDTVDYAAPTTDDLLVALQGSITAITWDDKWIVSIQEHPITADMLCDTLAEAWLFAKHKGILQ